MARKLYVTTSVKRVEKYITPGKLYEIFDVEGAGDRLTFCITADNGGELFCLLEGCCHLSGGDWTLVEPVVQDTLRRPRRRLML